MATVQPTLSDSELIERYCSYMEFRELRPTTISVRRYYLRKFAREVGFREATEARLQEWLSRPIQPQTRNTWIATIHGLYVFCNKRGYFERVQEPRTGYMVDFDPTAEMVKPKTRKGKPKPISDEDLARALKLADRKIRCWLLIGALCGARCQEIAGIRREDVHDTDPEPWLHIEHGKGNKQRDVPLHPLVIEALQAFGMPESGVLWTRTPQQLSREGNDFLHKEVGTKSTMHCLRHHYGTKLYRSTLDLQLTAGLLGHSNTAITSVYAASDRSKANAAVAAITIGEVAA